MVIIGVTGTLCSGKGVIVEFFKKKGFVSISLSDILREEANINNIELTRENLQKLGNLIREKHGSGVLAVLALEKVKDKDNVIIESIRNPGEVEVLKNNKNFKLIGVNAPRELRIERLLKRYNESSRKEDPISREEIINKIDIDEGKNQSSSGQQVIECLKMIDFYILNDRDLDYMHEELEKFFKELN